MVSNNEDLLCRSEYVPMRDGVRLAVSTWLAKKDGIENTKCPAVVITTRYWRAMAFKKDEPKCQQPYDPLASYLSARDYVLVVADARGSGASFGSRSAEAFPDEIDDIGEVIEWAAKQIWCDGRVATMGTSYTATSTLNSLVTSPLPLKLGVCRAPDFDLYRHLFAPGGIPNLWFIEVWGNLTAAQDKNDTKSLRATGHFAENIADNVLGVRPVDEDKDGTLLAAAIEEHAENFNACTLTQRMQFIDNGENNDIEGHFYNPHFYKEKIERGDLPLVIRCGWHDAATQLGAVSMFTSFSNPIRVILGPWNHSGLFLVDPFQPGDGKHPEKLSKDYVCSLTVKSLDNTFKKNKLEEGKEKSIDSNEFGVIEYYTLGENQWKTTREWPLPATRMQRLYLSTDHQLSHAAPEKGTGCDLYRVDPSTGTGLNNRWHTQMGGEIFFPNRREEDKKLLVYDTPPLEQNIEITGHPVVHLFIRSTATDGQFFVYLETVDIDGYVRLLTEGQLRALHRKVSDETPPYTMFGPYHSLKEKDAEPLVPGEVAEITFDLFPISVLLKKGQRIRLAIAGADKVVFAAIPGCESPEITLERNQVYASYIDLPFLR